jgi:hypothetical protein
MDVWGRRMLRKQLVGALGALAALLVIGLLARHVASLASWVTLPPDDAGGRLGFAVHWLVLPGLTLLAGIIGASRRGFYEDAIDGTRTPANHSLEINLRYNVNTVEQVVLAAIAWCALAVTLPHQQLLLIPAMALVFVFGRVTFWVGYLIHPMGRDFGMTLTVFPTLLAYAWLGRQMMLG